MSTLEIKDLYAHVETKDGIKPILKGVNLTVNSGETHAIMGPTVPANPPCIHAGRPPEVHRRLRPGAARRRGHPQDDPGRASQGGHLPGHAVPGRSAGRVHDQLPAHRQNRSGRQGAGHPYMDEGTVRSHEAAQDGPEVRHPFRERSFSGGEKKRAEVLQLELLKPKFAILDETDSASTSTRCASFPKV